MNRIDFHIHTVETASDSSGFNFDIEVLKDYVEGAHLAAIAITNHNGFYRDNYDQVSKALDIAVFPGAEINVTKLSGFGHVIIVADPADIDDFASGMATLAGECPGSSDHMSWERVVELFPKISNWLIIPHYKKSKKLDSATLSHIQSTAGYDALEVANAKNGSLSAMGPMHRLWFSATVVPAYACPMKIPTITYGVMHTATPTYNATK